MPAVDITDDVVAGLGPAYSPPAATAVVPASMRWDCSIGGLPFLFGMSDQYPMRRETGEFRRQRIDSERDPGEQSLDSGFWLRSQSSWHYGSGISTAEPLESNSDETRFRFARSGGVDPWTPGQLSLLHDTQQKLSSTGSSQFLLGVDTGVLHADATTVRYVTASSSATVTWGGSASAVTSMTSDGTNYYVANAVGIYKGALPSGSGSKAWDTGGITLVRWLKSRLMATVGKAVYELTGTGPTLPTALDAGTLRPTGWTWTDMAEGPTGIYLSGYAGDQSTIELVRVSASTGAVKLDPPVVVADMPRGERVLSLYAAVGSYLVVGTSRGCRVAAIRDDGSVTLGPLVVESADGCKDAVAVGSFVYVTMGGKGDAGDRVNRAGLWRINLGTNLDQSPLRFAAAADLVAPAGVSGACEQVTTVDGALWFTVTGSGVYRETATYVAAGWIESGRVRLGTVEPKAWRDMRVMMSQDYAGTVQGFANINGATAPSGWEQIISVSAANPDQYGGLGYAAPRAQQSLYAAFKITATDTAVSPVMVGYQLRAIPAPKRSELVQTTLLCMDFETDRTGVRYGSVGGAWARFSLVKDLEESAGTVQWLDYTTGERAEAYVERVVLVRTTPPSRGSKNGGGLLQVLLRLV